MSARMGARLALRDAKAAFRARTAVHADDLFLCTAGDANGTVGIGATDWIMVRLSDGTALPAFNPGGHVFVAGQAVQCRRMGDGPGPMALKVVARHPAASNLALYAVVNVAPTSGHPINAYSVYRLFPDASHTDYGYPASVAVVPHTLAAAPTAGVCLLITSPSPNTIHTNASGTWAALAMPANPGNTPVRMTTHDGAVWFARASADDSTLDLYTVTPPTATLQASIPGWSVNHGLQLAFSVTPLAAGDLCLSVFNGTTGLYELWRWDGAAASTVAIPAPAQAVGVGALFLEGGIYYLATRAGTDSFYSAPAVTGPWTLVNNGLSSRTWAVLGGALYATQGNIGSPTTAGEIVLPTSSATTIGSRTRLLKISVSESRLLVSQTHRTATAVNGFMAGGVAAMDGVVYVGTGKENNLEDGSLYQFGVFTYAEGAYARFLPTNVLGDYGGCRLLVVAGRVT